MAVRFDAAADRLLRTANNPSGSFTVLFDLYLTSDLNAYSMAFYMGPDNYGSNNHIYFGTDASGTTSVLGVNGYSETTGAAFSVGVWYRIALVYTALTSVQVYRDEVSLINITGGINAPNTARWEFGAVGSGNNDRWNGRVARIRRYDSALSLSQIRQLAFGYLPTITPYVGFWPCFGGATERLRDYSPNAYNFTAGGTLTDEAGPPQPMMWPWTYQPWSVVSGGTTYNQSVSGAITPSGLLAKQPAKIVAGSVTSSGATLKSSSTSKSGTVASSGLLNRRTDRALTGQTTPSGVLNSIIQRVISLTGSISPSGVIFKGTSTTKAGTTSPTGGLSKQTNRPLSGSVPSTGSLQKQIATFLSGSVSSSGALSAIKTALVNLVGSISPSGGLFKQISTTKSGSVTSSGSLLKSISTYLAGTIAPSGTLSSIKTFLISLTGSVSSSGLLSKQTQTEKTGSISPSGSLLRQTWKVLTGILTSSGNLSASKLTNTFYQSVDGVIAPAGELLKQTSRSLSGALNSIVGSLLKQTSRSLTGQTSPSGTLSALRTVLKLLDGAIGPSGSLTRQTSKQLSGSTAPTGGLIKLTFKNLSGAISSLVGSLLAFIQGAVSAIPTGTMEEIAVPRGLIALSLEPSAVVLEQSVVSQLTLQDMADSSISSTEIITGKLEKL